MSKQLLRLVLLLGCVAFATAQTERTTPFTGVWKLELTKSSFHPGPPFRSFAVTFAPDGTRKLDLIGADGQALQATLPWSDGKEVSVMVSQGNMENVTAVSKIQGRTFNDTWREKGKIIEKVRGVVSSDGGTLTTDVRGIDRQDLKFHNRLKFQKQ